MTYKKGCIQASPPEFKQIEKYKCLLYNEEHEVSEIQQLRDTHKTWMKLVKVNPQVYMQNAINKTQ